MTPLDAATPDLAPAPQAAAVPAPAEATPAPDPAPAPAEGHGIERPHDRVAVLIWQAPVRITHWLTACCIGGLSLTGGYIADPFLIPPGGDVMSTVRMVHIVTAVTFLVSGAVRTVYLLAGNRFVRWSAFIPTSWRQFTELFRQAGFYGFVRSEIPKVLGHNQLAAAAYLALFALLLVETVTGFALDGLMGAEPGATGFAWLRELAGAQTLRLVHHLAMWFILAIAFFHIYSCVLVDHIENVGVVSSMITGYKFPTREEVVESRDGGADALERAERRAAG